MATALPFIIFGNNTHTIQQTVLFDFVDQQV